MTGDPPLLYAIHHDGRLVGYARVEPFEVAYDGPETTGASIFAREAAERTITAAADDLPEDLAVPDPPTERTRAPNHLRAIAFVNRLADDHPATFRFEAVTDPDRTDSVAATFDADARLVFEGASGLAATDPDSDEDSG